MTPIVQGAETTHDTLLGGSITVVQPEDGYRVAVDPVLLAAAVDVPPGSRVLDAGCGTGAALMCLLARLENIHATGLEQQERFAELARKGLEANGLSDRADIITRDLADPPQGLAGAFDAVVTNPPFYQRDSVPHRPEQDSTHSVMDMSLASWIKHCLFFLRQEGVFAVIHRAERLAEIIQALSGCGAITVIPIWPKVTRPASRVIVTARKDRRSPAALHPGLVLHTDDERYTAAAEAILRNGEAFPSLS